MTEEEIINFVKNKISLSLNTSSHQESNKLDFKLKWYELNDVKGKNEFLKDCCSIINSYGGGHGFIVIGYGEKKKVFKDAEISNSGFNDDKYLIDIIRSKVDMYFNIQVFDVEIEIEGAKRKLSIIAIPPSLNKPHVITEYKEGATTYLNEIFVRHGSTNQRATKGDLDIMYSEKTSLIVDKQVNSTISFKSLRVPSELGKLTSRYSISSDLILHNVGSKNILVRKIIMEVKVEVLGEWEKDTLKFISKQDKFLIIKPDSVEHNIEHFEVDNRSPNFNQRLSEYYQNGIDAYILAINFIDLVLINNEVIRTNLTIENP